MAGKDDVVVLWGPAYTMDPERPWAEAVVMAKGRIVYVGNKDGSKEYVTPTATVIDITGADPPQSGYQVSYAWWCHNAESDGMILPGFQDAHVHPLSGMIIEMSCDLSKCAGLEQALQLIKEYAEANKELTWIVGGGWDVSWFAPDGLSQAHVLDAVLPDKPGVFRRADGHAVWANTAAMKAIGIYHKDPQEPPHGRIDKDRLTGFPIGSFQEQAGDLFQKHIPALSLDTRLQALELGMKRMASFGITAFQDALIRGPNIQAYEAAIKDPKRFPLKFSLCLWWDFHHAKAGDEDMWPHQIAEQTRKMESIRHNYCNLIRDTKNQLARVNTIKLMLDGVMETKTAYLSEPYCNCRSATSTSESDPHRGIANFPKEYLNLVTSAIDKAGFQIHCHSIGDNALTDVLDAFGLIKTERKRRGEWEDCDPRHQVAHLQVVKPSDIPRFRKLKVIANFQPYWSWKDKWMVLALEYLQGRAGWQYPIRQMIDSGARVCFGSDWFVSSLNPLDGIEVAISHLPLGTVEGSDESSDPFNPHQRISLAEALRAYTLGSAYANFLEDETGSLVVGKAADIIILDKNLFKIPTHAIHTAKVTHTFVNGHRVF